MAKKIVFNIEADTNFSDVDKQINEITSSTDGLTKQYKELRKAAQEATDPEEFRKLAQAAGELKDRIADTNRQINNFASDTRKLDVVVGSVRGIAGAFAAVQGTMALLGSENENLQKTLVKVQGSLAVLNGIQEVTKTLNKDSAVGAALYAAQNKILSVSIGTSTGALKAFRVALVSTGIGAIAVAIGLLIANFDKVQSAVDAAVEKFNSLGEGTKLLISILFPVVGIIRLITEGLERLGLIDTIETKKINKQIDELRRTTDRKIISDKNELEVLKAKGATQEEIFQKEKEILNESIKVYEETIRLKGKLNEKELEEYEKLIQQKRVLDAGYEKFRQDEAEKTAAEQQRQREAAINAERRNQQRRIDLLNEGLSKRLAQLRLNYEKERADAIKNGENIALVEQNYRLQIFKAIEDQNNKILNETATLQSKINQLRGTTFKNTKQSIEDETNAYIKGKLDESEAARETEKGKLVAIKNVRKAEDDATRASFTNSNERLKQLTKDTNDLIKETNKLGVIITDFTNKGNELINKRIELTNKVKKAEVDPTISLKNARKELADFNKENASNIENYQKQVNDYTKQYQKQVDVIEKNKAEISELTKENNKLGESVSKLANDYTVSGDEIDKATKENQKNILNAIKKANELKQLQIDIAGREAIIEGLKAEQKIREEIGEDTLLLQLNIFDKEFDLYKDNELRKIQSLLEAQGIEKSEIENTLKTYEDYYESLRVLRSQDVIDINKIKNEKKRLDELEKSSLDERLKAETDFQIKRNAVLESESGNDVLINFKKNLELRQLDRDLKKDLIENEKKFIKEKLRILADDPTRNEDEIKKLNKRILELDGELLQDRVDLQTEKNDILNNAIREYVAGIENILSGFNDFIGGLAAESNDLLKKIQDDNTKLLNEGKITQEEFNKLQEKATKDNENRQEKLFYQQQNIEVVRTIISGIASAQQAFQSQFSPVPDASSPARGAIAAGLALAAATARVLAIKKQKFQRSGTTAATPNLGSGRVVGGVGTSTVIEPTLRNDLGQSLRVFVLEGDITESQRRVRIVRGGSNATF